MENKFLLDGHRSINVLLRKLALGMDRPTLNRKMVSLTERLFGERKASILLLNPQNQTLHLEFAPNLPEFYNQAIEGVGIGEHVGSCGAAAFLKKPVIVDDINNHPNWTPFLPLTQKANLRACWSVPIISSDEHVLGTFAIYSDKPSTPLPFELEIAGLLASLYSVALEKYEQEEQLKFHANRDSLTHCYNRRALLTKVSSLVNNAATSDNVLACFFIDVDKFKYINDTHGHQIGDDTLIKVANILRETMVGSAKIGRYGGDEFVAFCCFASKGQAEDFHFKLSHRLNEELNINGYIFSSSVGMGCCELSELGEFSDLIAYADKDMYRIKQSKITR